MTEPNSRRILVVEDEEAIADGLVFNLRRKGYDVDLAADGAAALELAGGGRYHLIVLDVGLPRLDGFEVCRELRRRRVFTPILMLTARDQPDDVVFGLKTGADDYLVKPFDLAELLARVEGLLRRQDWSRRAEPAGAATGEQLPDRFVFGDYWVDFRTWQAQTQKGVVELSRKELAVMKVFAEKPNQVIERRELLDRVWELPNHPNTRVVDNVIVALRKAFEQNAWRPRHIHSVRGVGYRFVP
ncbi:MAG: DNA-binding response regulator, partial [Acidobacteria bacterium]